MRRRPAPTARGSGRRLPAVHLWQLYLSLVPAAAAGLLAYWWRAWPGLAFPDPALALPLLALAILTQQFPLTLGPQRKASTAVAAYFAALLLFGAPAAMGLTFLGQALGGLTLRLRHTPATGKPRRTIPEVVFNAGQLPLAVGLAGLVYYAWLPQRSPAALDRLADLWALPAAAAVLYLTNSGAVAVMAGLRRGRNPAAVWRADRGPATAEAGCLLLLGLAAALLASRYPWAPLLLAPPAALVQWSLGERLRQLEERRAAAERLTHQASHDPLTDLPNRALFRDRLVHALARRGRHARAVLFLDLDNFKVVNDSLGHAAGDRLLVEVAGRLQRCVRPEDTVARLGGDEFTILLDELTTADGAVLVAERVLDAVRAPITLDGREIVSSASVGMAIGTASVAADDLLRQADMALYRAKAAGKARHASFDPAMGARATRRLALELDLRRGLERGEFRLQYQPKVVPATGRMAGVEALVRWAHPERGLVAPGEFIALAEETGLIVPLGAWILTEACRQARQWQDRFPADPPLLMSVNLSARQFGDPDLLASILRILAATGLAPSSLGLELTESMAMADVESGGATLRALKGLGVRLALDDFGTGYSSLRALERLPVDALKIDPSFVAQVGQDGRAAGIVAAVIGLGHALGLQVVAEGVETAAQLAQLRDLGCDLVQGYYFARPLPAEAVDALLARAAVLRGVAGLPATAA